MRFSAYPLDQQMCKFLVRMKSLEYLKCFFKHYFHSYFLLCYASLIQIVRQTGSILYNCQFHQLVESSAWFSSYQPSSRGGKNNTVLSGWDVEKNNYTRGIITALSVSIPTSEIFVKRNCVTRKDVQRLAKP